MGLYRWFVCGSKELSICNDGFPYKTVEGECGLASEAMSIRAWFDVLQGKDWFLDQGARAVIEKYDRYDLGALGWWLMENRKGRIGALKGLRVQGRREVLLTLGMLDVVLEQLTGMRDMSWRRLSARGVSILEEGVIEGWRALGWELDREYKAMRYRWDMEGRRWYKVYEGKCMIE